MPVYRPSELAQLGIRARKSLSQNFLIDRNILEKITTSAEISPGDQVLEIGPGPGALTEHLLSKGAHVFAIEKDEGLAEKLTRLQTPDNRLTIAKEDALNFPIPPSKTKWKLVANLPYQITTPILQRFILEHEKIESLTLMVQREVAQRITSPKDTKEYGSLTLFVSAYANAQYCFTVKPSSFSPAPSVHSAVIHLKLHPFPFDFSEEEFFRFTRTAFGQRRKMIRGTLKEYGSQVIEEGLIQLALPPTARPGELSLEQFAALFTHFQAS